MSHLASQQQLLSNNSQGKLFSLIRERTQGRAYMPSNRFSFKLCPMMFFYYFKCKARTFSSMKYLPNRKLKLYRELTNALKNKHLKEFYFS